MLRRLDFAGSTSLKRIEPHRLQALVVEDLQRYPNSAIGDINKRIGEEISYRQVKSALDALCEAERVAFSGERRWRKYRLLT